MTVRGAGAALSGASGTLSKVLSAEGWRGAASSSVLNSLTGQAGARLAGLDTSFSWRSVAANAVAAGISASVTSRLSQSLKLDLGDEVGQFNQDLLGGAVGGVVSLHTRRAAGVDQRVDYGQVAVDAFGNAISNALTGEHSRRALATLERQHRADLINAELQGRLANGELQGAARAQALSRLGLPSDPKAHDSLWDRLPADGSRVLLDQRQGSNANGTPWTEQDWARRINDSFERQRFGGARVDFNTIRTDGVRDRRAAPVEALPAFIAAPARSPGWSLSQEIGLNIARGGGALAGVAKMGYEVLEGTGAGAYTFTQAALYQTGIAGMFDRWSGGNSYTLAGLQAGDRIGAGVQRLLDFAGSDYKGQIIADGIFSRFDDAAAKLSSQDAWTAFQGGMGIGQLTAEIGTSAYGGFQMARGGVGFAGRTADNFADLSKGKLYSLDGALGDVAKAAWRALVQKHPDIDPKQLALLTDLKGAHALERHGGVVTDEQLITRARTGLTADKHQGPIPRLSSAFHSDQLLAQADAFVRSSGRLENARASNSSEFRIKLSDMPEFRDLGADLGRGYAPVLKGDPLKVGGYEGPLQRFDSLRGVSGVYEFDHATQRWLTHTLYPDRY